ncbi:MAG: OprO/OprP family phosphate-selective porin [Odoribacteraceae bacterium]|jgi:hypothetical protein|nr:OprO/OprP family phosphate-selective porin [Odoribacteraceae bacterium]
MRKIFVLTCLAGSLLFMNTSRTIAQEVETRVDKIEKIISKLPSISGLVNLRYHYDNSTYYPDNSPSITTKSNSFDVRRARLDFRGGFSSFNYRLQVEFAKSPKILDAYVTWKATPHLNVQAGQYKIPFSLENPYGPASLETIDNSLVITYLVNYSDVSGVSANGRDIGLSVHGGFLPREGGYNILNYHAGIFNGNGINTSDNNNAKDVSAIFTVNPFKEFSVAASFYQGSGDRIRGGVGAKFENTRILVRTEYIAGETGTLKSEGHYTVFGYRVIPTLQLLAKYDYFILDRTISSSSSVTNETIKYLTGIRYTPMKNVQVMANYSFTNINGGIYKNHYLTTQVVLSF